MLVVGLGSTLELPSGTAESTSINVSEAHTSTIAGWKEVTFTGRRTTYHARFFLCSC